MTSVKNIIFDMGGVLVDIDMSKLIKALVDLGGIESPVLISVFENYEKGLISTPEFLAVLQDQMPRATTQMLKDAWNSIILDFPHERIDFIRSLKDDFRLFLLSNTNEIHIEKIKEMTGVLYPGFFQSFQKVYYSCEMGMRKPDAEIYHRVLEEQKLKPEETFFVDDSEENIETAKKMGLICWNLNPKTESVLDIKKQLYCF